MLELMPQTIVGMEVADIQAALGAGQPAFRARQIYDAVYRQRVTDLGEISNLPKILRGRLGHLFPLGWPKVEHRYDSVDGTRRYLLKLADGKAVETVWMPERSAPDRATVSAVGETADRATICISSQVGCAVDCKFCMTALMGLERSLTAGEIVGQVLLVARDNGLLADSKRFNIVMMGMGEPLL